MKYLTTILSVAIIVLILVLVTIGLISSVGSDVTKAITSFFRYIFGSLYGFSEVLVRATPLILAGLGVTVGFRTGFFNIGAEGQIYMGAIAATVVGLAFPNLPSFILIPFVILAGFLLGGFWSVIPGFLKARFGLSEVINTLMFNYIAINIVGILVRTSLKDPDYPLPMSPELPENMYLQQLLYPTRLHAGFIIALIASLLIYILMWKTVAGFKIRAVGLNPRGSRCSGISVYKNILLASFISGGLAGVAGVSEIAGLHHRLLEGISPGFGYIAIIVALLGQKHPAGVVFAAIGIAALQVGTMTMQIQSGAPASISWIIMGLLVLLILARETVSSFLKSDQEEGTPS
ncbi:ABC transporter permease [bacterium]|nr:ABC transporter permease [bacterium]